MSSQDKTPEEFRYSIPDGFRIFKIRQSKPRPKYRPIWSQNEQDLIRHAAGIHAMRRIQIARMYWLENKSQREIAKTLNLKLGTVASTISALSHRKSEASRTLK